MGQGRGDRRQKKRIRVRRAPVRPWTVTVSGPVPQPAGRRAGHCNPSAPAPAVCDVPSSPQWIAPPGPQRSWVPQPPPRSGCGPGLLRCQGRGLVGGSSHVRRRPHRRSELGRLGTQQPGPGGQGTCGEDGAHPDPARRRTVMGYSEKAEVFGVFDPLLPPAPATVSQVQHLGLAG